MEDTRRVLLVHYMKYRLASSRHTKRLLILTPSGRTHEGGIRSLTRLALHGLQPRRDLVCALLGWNRSPEPLGLIVKKCCLVDVVNGGRAFPVFC